MTLGEIIKAYRKEHEMSMDAFADKSGISKAYISILEKNRHPKTGRPIAPSIETIKQAADGMGLDFNKLFNMLDSDVDLAPTASMNWFDDPEPADPEPIILTLEEQTLLRNYKQLNRDGQLHLLEYADNMTHMLKYSKETSLMGENIG